MLIGAFLENKHYQSTNRSTYLERVKLFSFSIKFHNNQEDKKYLKKQYVSILKVEI